MRKKVRRSLALLLALTMMVTLVKSEELFVSAESGSAAEQVSSDTEEAVLEETPEEASGETEISVSEPETIEAISAEETAEDTPTEAGEVSETEESTPEDGIAEAENIGSALNTEPETAAEEAEALTEEIPEGELTSSDNAEEAAAELSDKEGQENTGEKAADEAAETEKSVLPAEDPAESAEKESPQKLEEQTITARMLQNGSANIILSGNLPEGAYAKAYPVDVEIDGETVLAAYDITIYDADDAVFQPEDDVIQVKIEDAAVEQAIQDEQNVAVYHMSDADAAPEPVEQVTTDEVSVEFAASSFSIYIVTTPETHFTHTYTFCDSDGSALADIPVQILSEGESLTEPAALEKPHMVFKGWYTAQEGGTLFDGFGQTEGVLTADAETKLYARYSEVYYVQYMSAGTDGKVLYTQTYSDADAKIVTDNVPFDTGDVEMALVGWSTDPNAEAPDASLTLAGDDVTLYPVVKAAHWITYDSQGGSVVDPVYVLAGAVTAAPTVPSRTGYAFAGWYTEDGTEFLFGNTLEPNITLYAKWTPSNTTYTVIYWRQQVTDSKNAADSEKKYDYAESVQRSAVTGTTVSVAASDRNKAGTGDYVGFEYNSAKQTTAEVAADGSTVLNVYFDRLLITYAFYDSTSSGTPSSTFTGLYGSTLAFNGYTWPGSSTSAYEYYKNNNTWSSSTGMTFLDAFLYQPNTGTATTINFYKKTAGRHTYYHYKEALDGTWELANTATGSSSTYTVTNKYNGFTVSRYSYDNSAWTSCSVGDSISKGNHTVMYLRYTRNSYALDYIYNGNVVKSEEVKYEAPLAGYASYIPDRPSGLASYYVFQGWYKDPECTEMFDFDQIMPANNLAAYAKWVPKQVTVTFDLNGAESEDDAYNDQSIGAGTAVTKPADPVREGYTFAGWTRDGQPFNFNTLLIENTTLTAQWISMEEYTLTYDPGDGTGAPVKDSTPYADGAEAKLAEVPDTFTAPDEHEGFVCWNTKADGSGDSYYPGSAYTIDARTADADKNVVLYAQWEPLRKTSLTYDYNGGTLDGEVSSTVDIETPNSEYAVAELEPVRDGYEFIGWSTSQNPEEDEALLTAGDKIQVDTLEPEKNVLYAQWKRNVSLTVEKQMRGNMGETERLFDFEYTVTKADGTDGGNGTFKLKKDGTYTIEQLPEGCTVTVKEVLAGKEGYKTYVSTESGGETEAGSVSVTMDADKRVTFINEKNASAPTGVYQNTAPYLAMLMIALCWLAWSFGCFSGRIAGRKKNR